MNIDEKLRILSDAAKYDVSCSSSGSNRKNPNKKLGDTSSSGICHSFSADGRCISLLKILLTNYCIFDCAYCINKASNDVPRAAFTADEIVNLTMNFYRRNYIEGLFLSSAIIVNQNHTMELITEVVYKLRVIEGFNGYIHIKAIPGADSALIKKAGQYVDRMSVNIELPSDRSLRLLAPQKNKESILKPMSFINSQITATKEERKIFKSSPNFVPAGQSTQLIIGATEDTDLKILSLSENLYDKMKLKRVYYSAYMPVVTNSKLPELKAPPLLREHRLYQADWLLRFYGFKSNELLDKNQPNFDLHLDPKCNWAINNIEQFPVEINTAPTHLLLRIPGIGVRSVSKIVKARTMSKLGFEDLKKLGVVLKRAKYFITCCGKYEGDVGLNSRLIRNKLLPKEISNISSGEKYEQLSFLNEITNYTPSDFLSKIHGEL